MRRLTTLVAGAVAATFLFGVGSLRQPDEEMKPQKYEDVTWHTVVNVRFHADQRDDALKIIDEHFLPAAESGGAQIPVFYEYATGGKWDLMMLWHMPDGPAALEWRMSPNEVKWFGALIEQEGGLEAAEAVLDDYVSKIAERDAQIVRHRE